MFNRFDCLDKKLFTLVDEEDERGRYYTRSHQSKIKILRKKYS